MTSRARHRAPDGLLVEWQPQTPTDHAAVRRIGKANVLAVATQRIITALRNDRTADLTKLLHAVPEALEVLRSADADYTALAVGKQPTSAAENKPVKDQPR